MNNLDVYSKSKEKWDFEGDLWTHNFEGPGLKRSIVLRKDYKKHFRYITKGKELLACLRAGKYAWPGGYTTFFICSDGAFLSHESVRENLKSSIIDSIRNKLDDGWWVIGMMTIEDMDGEGAWCSHSGEQIE